LQSIRENNYTKNHITTQSEILHWIQIVNTVKFIFKKSIINNEGFMIETEDQLEEALYTAESIHSREPCILDVRLDIHDGSPALQRLTESLGKKST
jgi:hypothetical protein